jgi:hypothetical protein
VTGIVEEELDNFTTVGTVLGKCIRDGAVGMEMDDGEVGGKTGGMSGVSRMGSGMEY